jgi:hypothetical protein
VVEIGLVANGCIGGKTNMGKACVWMAVVAVAVAALSMGTGCDDGGGIDGLTVTPNSQILTGNVFTAVFTASVSGPLALPLEWRVSNPAIGIIREASGSNAVYEAYTQVRVDTNGVSSMGVMPGANVVTARDQYGNEGSAGVTQR